MTTSRLLHERMREKGYSKIRLQNELGCCEKTLRNYLNGTTTSGPYLMKLLAILNISVSEWNSCENIKQEVYTPLFSNMGEAAALQPDELVFGAMMSGFNEKCYDGLSFFNTAHKVGDATYSNRSNKKLSRESYMEGRSSIMSIKGDKGKSLKLVPDLLVVPPALEETARLILEADQIDGTTNVLKGTASFSI